MKKNILITVLGLLAVVGVGIFTIRSVRADESGSYSPLVEKLIAKFNLNKDEVGSVVSEYKNERQQEMLRFKEERLNQAVADGIISESQKQALLAKFSQMQKEREEHQEEMQNWFAQQGIEQAKLAPYLGFGHHGGFGGRDMWMMR